jgi:hypothetical protein
MAAWRKRVTEALVTVLAAVVARVAWALLGPLLPYLVTIVAVGAIVLFVIRGAHPG